MSLIDLYDSLPVLEEGNNKTFNAVKISNFPSHRVAINIEGNPTLLLSISHDLNNLSLKNLRLKYFQLELNVECKITENKESIFQTLTIITFKSSDRTLQEYFLRVSETLIRTLGYKPTAKKVIDSLNGFVEIFRALSTTPTKTVHGLWSELFLISISSNPYVLLDFWHNIPEEKFDFNSGNEKIEVKSNTSFERVHIFKSEQLNPPIGTQVLIASIFIKQKINGLSIIQLVERISEKIQGNIELLEKLNIIISKTLGNSFEQSIKIKFDYDIAKDSLQFYSHLDVSKIEKINIPNEVSGVRYASDLSIVKSIELESLVNAGLLFKSI